MTQGPSEYRRYRQRASREGSEAVSDGAELLVPGFEYARPVVLQERYDVRMGRRAHAALVLADRIQPFEDDPAEVKECSLHVVHHPAV